MKLVDKFKYKDRDYLIRQHWDNFITIDGIAKKCGVGAQTIKAWMKKHNIKIRVKNIPKKEYTNRVEIGRCRSCKHWECLSGKRSALAPSPRRGTCSKILVAMDVYDRTVADIAYYYSGEALVKDKDIDLYTCEFYGCVQFEEVDG